MDYAQGLAPGEFQYGKRSRANGCVRALRARQHLHGHLRQVLGECRELIKLGIHDSGASDLLAQRGFPEHGGDLQPPLVQHGL
jgi:hypothetical protein